MAGAHKSNCPMTPLPPLPLVHLSEADESDIEVRWKRSSPERCSFIRRIRFCFPSLVLSDFGSSTSITGSEDLSFLMCINCATGDILTRLRQRLILR
ncbi:hypothetical protein Mapa_012769 [Marchantia paleacea]|nr:hypothetical protein Mapa_012769 [Marchantia paleacea]